MYLVLRKLKEDAKSATALPSGLSEVACNCLSIELYCGLALYALCRSGKKQFNGSDLESIELLNTYKDVKRCEGKNVLVCKTCLEQFMDGVSLLVKEGNFNVWCLDSGDVHNYVRCLSC